jgi:hypothetical protein
LIGNFARGYGGNRNKRDGAYHDHVRGFLPLILRRARIASTPCSMACSRWQPAAIRAGGLGGTSLGHAALIVSAACDAADCKACSLGALGIVRPHDPIDLVGRPRRQPRYLPRVTSLRLGLLSNRASLVNDLFAAR